MKNQDLKVSIANAISEVTNGKSFSVAVCLVNGIETRFDEYDFRAMQLLVSRMSDDEYTDFCNSVTIYDVTDIEDATDDDVITILKDGRLSRAFTTGFLSIADELAMQIFRERAILH